MYKEIYMDCIRGQAEWDGSIFISQVLSNEFRAVKLIKRLENFGCSVDPKVGHPSQDEQNDLE
jgi:hypothetical protein